MFIFMETKLECKLYLHLFSVVYRYAHYVYSLPDNCLPINSLLNGYKMTRLIMISTDHKALVYDGNE